jgi:anti-sigma regulatory factor (Ser/Thr protein kinase)
MAVASTSILAVLHAYVPAELAENMLRRALGRAGVGGESVEDDAVDRVFDAVQIGINLFIEPSRRARASAELRELVGIAPETYLATVPVQTAVDVLDARTRGREIASRLGARSLIAQRVSSVISELGAVLLELSGTGTMELRGVRTEPRLTIVTAGKFSLSIEELDALARDTARRSRGMGLAAVRRTVDRFHLKSDGAQTAIETQIFV